MRILIFILVFAFSEACAQEKSSFSISSPNFKFAENLSSDFEFNGFGCQQSVTADYSSCNSNNNRFAGLDCNGKNKAPDIIISNPPKGTKSFAFTIFDPDAQTESGWWHFVAYNIPANTREIKNAQLPQGSMLANNDGGYKGYMGACPNRKSGKHRYVFTVYALNIEQLDIPANAGGALSSYIINQHKIDTATLLGFYERK